MERVISFLGMNLRAAPLAAPTSRVRAPARSGERRLLPAGSLAPPGAAATSPEGAPHFVHRADGRLAAAVHDDGTRETFEYDRRGNLVRRVTAAGRVLEYGYDDEDRLAFVTHDGEGVARFEAGAGGRWMESPDCLAQVRVDAAERPLHVTQTIEGRAFVTEYRYDDAGHVTGIRPPGSEQWLRFSYDGATVTLHADDGTPYATASLDGQRVRFANGVEDVHHTDDAGRIRALSVTGAGGASLPELAIDYDASLRIRRIGGRRFEYGAGRCLTGFQDGDGARVRYTYDARGNRLTTSGAEGTAHYTYDARDRLTALTRADGTTVTFGYDRDGHLVRRTEGRTTTTYERGADGRLLAVRQGGRHVARYGYDALGRRVGREGAGGTTIFHYDALHRLLAETDPEGGVRSTYLWIGLRCVARLDGPVGAPAVFLHTDHLGSVRGTSGADGELRYLGEPHPFGEDGPPVFAAKPRDAATGLYHFGVRDYDPETGRFLTPDPFSCTPDDHRLLFGSGRDFWGERRVDQPGVGAEAADPLRRHRYLLCLNDPVNHVDPMGNSAWWFFLTIPSSITWNLPNTVIALLIVIGNIIMEILGWILFPIMCLANKEWAARHYPWGNLNPSNPFDPDERTHFWFNLDASARLGVPWTIMTGSFFVWRAYTLGNVVFIEDAQDNANATDANARFVVPNDPDTRLSRQDALRHHEMQHVFQYSLLGPLFHCMPIPLIVRIVHQATGGSEEREWWDEVSLGGIAKLTAGGLVWLLSGGRVDWDDVRHWVNPATWWSELIPGDWVKIVSKAWDLDSWMPLVGVYEWDLLINGGQNNSFFERNAGANSGDVYKTVVEAERRSIRVGEFTRIVGADVVPGPPTGAPTTVAFTIAPGMTTPTGLVTDVPAPPPAPPSPYQIDLDSGLTLPVQVVNGSGMYFHSLAPGTYTVTGRGSLSTPTETVQIEVRDVDVTVSGTAFVCQAQTLSIKGDPAATYSVRFAAGGNNSGATLAGMAYTAGKTAATDTLEVVARYAAGAGAFAKYGDNGLAAADYVVRTLTITVSEPTITPDTTDIFVGGIVRFTVDHRPQTGSATTNIAGSVFDLAALEFHAGRGPIAANQIETVTFDYGCHQYTFDVTVRPITAVIAPAIVNGGATAQITVTGGVPPYRFTVSVANSKGASVNASGQYTAGSENALVTDTVTVTDRNGEGGRARVDVQVRPMTATATPPSVAAGGQSTISAQSGVTPFAFQITHRESTGSTVSGAGLYTGGSTPGLDTVRVTDARGTQVSVTVTVTG
jgi:RHS repeat-associated protein